MTVCIWLVRCEPIVKIMNEGLAPKSMFIVAKEIGVWQALQHENLQSLVSKRMVVIFESRFTTKSRPCCKMGRNHCRSNFIPECRYLAQVAE